MIDPRPELYLPAEGADWFTRKRVIRRAIMQMISSFPLQGIVFDGLLTGIGVCVCSVTSRLLRVRSPRIEDCR